MTHHKRKPSQDNTENQLSDESVGDNEDTLPAAKRHRKGSTIASDDEYGEPDSPAPLPEPRRGPSRLAASKPKQRDIQDRESDAAKLARLKKQTLLLQQKLYAGSKTAQVQQDDRNGDIESEEETRQTGQTSVHFGSSITPMQTITRQAPPHLDLACIHRRQKPVVEKTPRRAFLTVPSDGISSESDGEHSPSMLTSSSPAPILIPTSGSNDPTPCHNPVHNQSININPSAQIGSTPTAINNTNDELPPLPFVADYKPGKGRPKASDYDSIGEAIILRAAVYYESKIVGVNCFPKVATQTLWAQKGFNEACRLADKKFASSNRIISILRSRGSRIRGDILDAVRLAVISSYGFSSDTTKKARRHNLDLYNKLTYKMAFAFGDMDNHKKFAEHPIFQLLLRNVCFSKGSESPGIIYSRFFNPVSLETLAFFMTEIRYILDQCSTGIWIKLDKRQGFTEAQNKKHFDEYLEELKRWDTCAKDVVQNIRKRMYTRAREKSGIDPKGTAAVITGSMKTQMELELAARTGETDSESENNDSDGDTDGPDNGGIEDPVNGVAGVPEKDQ
ncbi:hypothetical protein VKT23_017650 [Stygiomarasmius scandens]|uniref:DUF6532 domain-containing protein n=1 Tax=Marasmiellus scandens TaxID=2682957 RepID=A0ABR1IRB6_9AGAR